MKAFIQLLSLSALLIFVTSCNKEEIPGPNENVSVSVDHSLFISGEFDGVQETKTIDGIQYEGHSGHVNSTPLGEWHFDLLKMNADTVIFPELSFCLLNHDQSSILDYQDLVLSTSSPTIEFIDSGSPIETQFGRLSVYYIPNENDFYVSDLAVTNSPLELIEAKDTLVDGTQYRILELSGSINLRSINTLDTLSIENFHARMAFGL